jgi:hypothetical protein
MQFQDFLIPALERVLAWEIPDEVCGQALSDEAGLMAGADPEQGGWDYDD